MGKPGTSPAEVLPGQTRFMAYDKNPVTHRVYNAGKDVFHVMDIELVKKEPSNDSCVGLQNKNIETTINEKLVRVYRFELRSQQTVAVPAGTCAHLLVCIAGEVNTTGKTITPGEYVFFDPGKAVSVYNKRTVPATCVILELK